MKTANILTLLFLRYRILLFLLKTEKSPSTFAELWATNLESEFPRREKKEGKWKRKRKTWNQNPSIFQCNENFEQQIQQCMTQKPNRLHLCVLVLLCYVIDFLKLKALDFLFPSINSEPGARNINLLLFSRYYQHQSELTVWFIPSSESMAPRHLPLTVSPPLLRFKFNQIWIGFALLILLLVLRWATTYCYYYYGRGIIEMCFGWFASFIFLLDTLIFDGLKVSVWKGEHLRTFSLCSFVQSKMGFFFFFISIFVWFNQR